MQKHNTGSLTLGYIKTSSWALVVMLVVVSAARAEDKQAREILHRAIAAMGGEQNIARLKAPMMWMVQGTYYGTGEGVPYIAQYASKWPDWYREEIENVYAVTVNGDRAWITSDTGINTLAGGSLNERLWQARVAWAERLFPLTGEAYTLSSIEGIEVDGRATVGIKASHVEGRDIQLFFDKQSYRLAMIATMITSDEHGRDPVRSEIHYADQRSLGGIGIPSKFRVYRDNKLLIEGETIDYKVHATLDPAQFQTPE